MRFRLLLTFLLVCVGLEAKDYVVRDLEGLLKDQGISYEYVESALLNDKGNVAILLDLEQLYVIDKTKKAKKVEGLPSEGVRIESIVAYSKKGHIAGTLVESDSFAASIPFLHDPEKGFIDIREAINAEEGDAFMLWGRALGVNEKGFVIGDGTFVIDDDDEEEMGFIYHPKKGLGVLFEGTPIAINAINQVLIEEEGQYFLHDDIHEQRLIHDGEKSVGAFLTERGGVAIAEESDAFFYSTIPTISNAKKKVIRLLHLTDINIQHTALLHSGEHAKTPSRAYIWTEKTDVQSITVPWEVAGVSMFGLAINDRGRVLGYATGKQLGGNTRLFLWDEKRGSRDLYDVLHKDQPRDWVVNTSYPVAFNERHEILLSHTSHDGGYHPYFLVPTKD